MPSCLMIPVCSSTPVMLYTWAAREAGVFSPRPALSLQDVLRNWYARLPTIVHNANALVSNAEECAQALQQGTAQLVLWTEGN